MKHVWKFVKGAGKVFTEMCNRKVTYVVQNKRLANHCYSCWNGELDNDQYFSIQLLDGVIMASMKERELELALKTTPVAYIEQMERMISASNEVERVQELLIAKSTFLPKFTKELTFEELMEVFMWKYISPSVEVYENITVLYESIDI